MPQGPEFCVWAPAEGPQVRTGSLPTISFKTHTLGLAEAQPAGVRTDRVFTSPLG
jgi:hypothetical protein